MVLAGAGVGVFALLLVGAGLVRGQQVNQTKSDVRAAQAETVTVNGQIAKLADIQALETHIAAKQQDVTSALKGDLAWSTLLPQVTGALPANAYLSSMTVAAANPVIAGEGHRERNSRRPHRRGGVPGEPRQVADGRQGLAGLVEPVHRNRAGHLHGNGGDHTRGGFEPRRSARRNPMNRRNLMIGAAGLVVICLAWYVLLWSPKSSDLSKAKSERTTAEQETSAAKLKLAGLQSAAGTVVSYRSTEAKLVSLVPDDSQLSCVDRPDQPGGV